MHEPGSSTYSAFLTRPTGDIDIDNDLRYIRNLDWDESGIGPISTWPNELLVLVNLAILSPQPQLFLLGHDSRILYNTAYGRLLRDHHPTYQGRPIQLNTALIAQAPAIDRIVQSAKTKSKPANENDVPFFFLNQNQLEEVFLSATMVHLPLSLDGYHATTYDTTAAVLHSRREHSLYYIRHICEKATDLESFWSSLRDGISAANMDIAFAAIYHAESRVLCDKNTGYISKRIETGTFKLGGTVGSFQGQPQASLERSDGHSWIKKIFKAADFKNFELMSAEDGTLPSEMCQASRDRCYGDDCRTAVVVPSTSEKDTIPAVLILGLAPRRPYDQAYQVWIETIHHTFAYHVARLSMLEEKAIAKANDEKRESRAKEIMAKELLLKEQEAALATGKVQRMLKIMEAASVGVFECDSSGTVTQYNEAFRMMSDHGNRLQTSLPTRLQDLCQPRDRCMFDDQFRVLVAGHPTTFSVRFRGVNKDCCQWVLIACIPELNEVGDFIGVSGCMTNIDAQKEVEYEARRNRAGALRQLRLTETRLSNFIRNAPFGILIMDQTGLTSFINETWLQLTGHPNVPVHEVDIRSVVHPEDLPKVDECLKKVSNNGRFETLQIRLNQLWAGGTKGVIRHTWVQFTAYVETEDGKHGQITTTLTDVSGFKFSEALHQARLEEAVQARRQQENFVDMISHEIRNPLSAVLHSIDALFGLVSESKSLLDQTPLYEQPFRQLRVWNNDMLEFVDTIRSCNTHQRRITDDILVLSKLDSELFLISPTVFHLETFVRQIEKTFGPEAKEAKIDFTVSIDDSAQSLGIEWVKADSGRFMQVLTSLVANAIKFTRDQNGLRDIDIRLGASLSPDLPAFINLNMVEDTTCEDSTDNILHEDELYLWCSVRDTGCGMDTKGMTRILSQASPKTYNRYGGSGFGLVVSRKLVKLQAGRIGFISDQGAGSTFVFSAKATRTSSNELQLSQGMEKKLSSAAHRSKPSLIGPNEKPPQYNILLVEDNLINQKVLKNSLLRHGFSVQVSNNGLEAITFLKTTKCWNSCNMQSETQPAVDLILMDIEMPVMDGLECAKAIRAAQADGTLGRHIPIVAVTANARPAQLEAALDAGMDDTIVKPFRITDLEPILHRFLVM